ncbi:MULTISPECIES: DUF2243 domain-containing protein [Bacillaceae]|uniref:DUF2243 domain-containing protein n=1 Tax=Evansella alkalicola TaxID=745819 RepID=A0ABS6JXQ9_9BACI|nr:MULTISPECIES: DUF2243 domain-containing protein [Bacillaceae]MBU9723386.1 DUF2243 domain-containing protein [Bacillus alkalicola]
MSVKTKRKLIVIGSFILGFGFLGAMDGIMFHQILQWHSVVMDTDRTGQIMSDGIFHFATTITLVAGGVILWLAGNPTDLSKGVRLLVGYFMIGGGTFNLIEGIINHHILEIHRVRPDAANPLMYDLAFLASGVILIVVGLLIKRGRRTTPTTITG